MSDGAWGLGVSDGEEQRLETNQVMEKQRRCEWFACHDLVR